MTTASWQRADNHTRSFMPGAAWKGFNARLHVEMFKPGFSCGCVSLKSCYGQCMPGGVMASERAITFKWPLRMDTLNLSKNCAKKGFPELQLLLFNM